ncbi:MAG: CBS domain-containing protein [Thermodesulfobacteriota bacterium]|nr:CBS domain-containing protein [Thermodesulfobacteriota bacterium]
MKVKDIMTTNVVSITPDTTVLKAAEIMQAHGFERLPVVEKEKLKGIITKDRLLRASPSQAMPGMNEFVHHLLGKMTISEIMETRVITIGPDMPVENAVALGQDKKVGCLPVLEHENRGRLLGIVTTNDFFYRILNPLLGIGDSGLRIKVANCDDTNKMRKILDIIMKHEGKILTMSYSRIADQPEKQLIVHFESGNTDSIVKDLENSNIDVEIREREI